MSNKVFAFQLVEFVRVENTAPNYIGLAQDAPKLPSLQELAAAGVEVPNVEIPILDAPSVNALPVQELHDKIAEQNAKLEEAMVVLEASQELLANVGISQESLMQAV